MFYELIPTKLFRKDASSLTYSSNIPLTPGQIALVPLGKSTTPAIVWKPVKKPSYPCKPVQKLLYSTPLPHHLLQSLFWLSKYYLTPLPTVASLFLPKGVEKTRRRSKNDKLSFLNDSARAGIQDLADSLVEENPWPAQIRTAFSETSLNQEALKPHEPRTSEEKISCRPLLLNQHQLQALASLNQIKNHTKFLFGITGSGKTNIYLKLAQDTLAQNQSVILLVPEIALTSQLVQIFESTFPGRTILLHSRQTEAERHLLWERILSTTGSEPNGLVVIGPRSALLAPVSNLGLIIVDEAHESSYFQENPPKYSALRLASFIAKEKNITCLLGSATPSIQDFYLAQQKSSLVSLTQKAKDTAITPEIKIVDFTSRDAFLKSRYFSNTLLKTIQENLDNGYQTLIYHNRRGSAPLTLCEHCGWQALCPACFLPLTLHSDQYSLICHTCGLTQKLPSSCPSCHSPSILHKGFGTKLLETELKKLFKDAKIARFDTDNTKTDSLDARYEEVKSGEINIIIGTQTVSRGLDLPHLASIGIVQADAGLSLPDFSAEEKTFQLLTQVIGRVGRGHLNTASVIIQTFQPDNPLIHFAINSDYPGFYNFLIKKRKKQALPPFTYLCKLTVTAKTEKTTLQKIHQVQKLLNNLNSPKIHLSSPMPCFHEHTASGYSWQIILKSKNRTALLSLLQNLLSSCPSSLTPHLSLDPPSLL